MVDFRIRVDLRINETRQTGAVRKSSLLFGRHCFQLCLCGAVENRTYRGESAYLFLVFTINNLYGNSFINFLGFYSCFLHN